MIFKEYITLTSKNISAESCTNKTNEPILVKFATHEKHNKTIVTI